MVVINDISLLPKLTHYFIVVLINADILHDLVCGSPSLYLTLLSAHWLLKEGTSLRLLFFSYATNHANIIASATGW